MTITSEQNQALAELAALLPGRRAADPLQTWLGISRGEVAGAVQGLLARKDAFENRLLDWAGRRPLDAAFEFLASAALAFYRAEKGVNPKVRSYVDAFYYIATCASVGYADVFAITQAGRAIAGLVMVVGPALAGHALDRPAQVQGAANTSICSGLRT